ncbi:YaaA family protein [uncultured Duncaniella sp.]|uniref:YaaA family protein n=1 Tax=uncultured Duncaniella sp. TaxID=2768039 RepID=UPI0025AA2ACA|nr:YaaA family protein [uncultured Duncaniella sp.]
MLILIAESKTMTPCDGMINECDYMSHRPALESDAAGIMSNLRSLSAESLCGSVKLSLPMVRKLQQMIYEFPNKASGSKAMNAFTGVVFKAFSYQTLGEASRVRTNGRVRIISSLYGWLKPDDIINSYRFDFTTPLAPDGKTFSSYWRDSVTKLLLKEIEKQDCHDVLNLLPGDAARCIDWKVINSRVKVWKADFKEVHPGAVMRTPNAGRLKTLRGRLLRQIINEDIMSPEQLVSIIGDGYIGPDSIDVSGNILFHSITDN